MRQTFFRRLQARLAAAALAAASITAGGRALAEAPPSDADVAIARKLVVDGSAALDKKDYAAAEDRFSRADALYHAPTITLGLARARAGLGKLVAAQAAYNKVVHTTVDAGASAAFVKAIEDARAELAALEPRIPSIVVQVKGAQAPRVTIDGVDVAAASLGEPRPADPGKHVVRASAPGFAAAEASVTLAEKKTETIVLQLKPGEGTAGTLGPTQASPTYAPARAERSVRKPLGIAAIVVGGVAVVVGAATGAVGLSKESDLLTHCPNGSCPSNSMPQYGSEVSTYNTMAATSTATLVIGGALAVTGIVLIATAPKPATAASRWTLAPVVGAGYLGVRGAL